MEDTPMIAQGLTYNWAERHNWLAGSGYRPETLGQPKPKGRPLRECWRWWPHNPHLHMGPKGKDSMTRCPGRDTRRDVTPCR